MRSIIEGRYANYFDVGHNAFEFVIDCGQSFSEMNDVVCHTRIITSPVYAAALFKTLAEGLQRYKEKYGEIPEIEEEIHSFVELIC